VFFSQCCHVFECWEYFWTILKIKSLWKRILNELLWKQPWTYLSPSNCFWNTEELISCLVLSLISFSSCTSTSVSQFCHVLECWEYFWTILKIKSLWKRIINELLWKQPRTYLSPSNCIWKTEELISCLVMFPDFFFVLYVYICVLQPMLPRIRVLGSKRSAVRIKLCIEAYLIRSMLYLWVEIVYTCFWGDKRLKSNTPLFILNGLAITWHSDFSV
jgi:hypothetical protein